MNLHFGEDTLTVAGALIVLTVGIIAAVVTVVLAVSAESKELAAEQQTRLAGPWWQDQEWWSALSPEERQWVLQNLASSGHRDAATAMPPRDPSVQSPSTDGESEK